jgi:sporulation-control protein spo0M
VFDIILDDDAKEIHLLRHLVKQQESLMSDFSKLNADIADLAAKVDALVAKQAPPPVDEQPAVDAADKAIADIIAKIPA